VNCCPGNPCPVRLRSSSWTTFVMDLSDCVIDDPCVFGIVTMVDPVGHVMGAQAAQGIEQFVPGARLGPAESGLDLRPAFLNRVQGGQVGRHVLPARATPRNRRTRAASGSARTNGLPLEPWGPPSHLCARRSDDTDARNAVVAVPIPDNPKPGQCAACGHKGGCDRARLGGVCQGRHIRPILTRPIVTIPIGPSWPRRSHRLPQEFGRPAITAG
jgi:hypothetical protein